MSSARLPLPPPIGGTEHDGHPGNDRCTICRQPAGHWYFRVNGAMACTPCAQKARNPAPADSPSAYTRALFFGAGAAFGGLVLLAAFGIMTDWMVGYLALGVAYLVGKAMMKGSKGIGGVRYQIAAALLTYLTVSMSAIPVGLAYTLLHRREYHPQVPVQKKPADLAEDQRQLEQEFGSGNTESLPPRTSGAAPPTADSSHAQATAPLSRQAPPYPAQQRPPIGAPAALGYISLFALASPLLWLQSPFQGSIAILVLIVGVVVAWQITAAKRSEIIGPFRNNPASR